MDPEQELDYDLVEVEDFDALLVLPQRNVSDGC
jgi:hypothetical protein